MWGIVKFVDSNDYCVVRSDQVSKGHFVKGKPVDIVYGGTVLYTNSSKLACEKECEKLLNSINSQSDCVSTYPRITRVDPSDSTPLVDKHLPTSSDIALLSSQMDKLLTAFNTMSRQVFSRLEDLESRQLEMEHVLQCHARLGAEVKNSVSTLMSSNTEILTRLPPASETHPALTYPYNLTKEQVDEMQLKANTATSFARSVERKLFKNEEDKDENLENRAAQDKVRWLRELVKHRYPTKNGVNDDTTWNACRKGINDYHRKQRKRMGSIFSEIPPAEERIFYPPSTSEPISTPPTLDKSAYLFLASPKH
ncbi:hypothetical protein Aduo_011291 [Ancylostoma duodenale]